VATSDGIHIAGAGTAGDNCLIAGNYVEDCNNHGINLDGAAENNHIANNFLRENDGTGIVESASGVNNDFNGNSFDPKPAEWQATTAYSLGDFVVALNGANETIYFEVTTAGTSGGAEPAWNTTVKGTTADGTVTWTTRGIVSLAGTKRTRLERQGRLVTQEGFTEAVSIYDTTGGLDVTAGAVVPFDTLQTNTNTDVYTPDLVTNNDITIEENGTYLVSYEVSCEATTNNQPSDVATWLERDTGGGYAEVLGTRAHCGELEFGEGEHGTAPCTTLLALNKGDKLRVWAVRDNGASTILLVADGSRLTLLRIA
jgi:hypothetical protein